MKMRFVLAMLAYLLPTFPLGYFWHLVTFAEQYKRLALLREDVIIPFGLTTMVIQAVAFAWAYPKLFGAEGRHWLRGALGFGTFFGALAWSFAVLPAAAKYRMSSVADFVLLESTFTLLQFLIVSPLIALAYRPSAQRLSPAVSA